LLTVKPLPNNGRSLRAADLCCAEAAVDLGRLLPSESEVCNQKAEVDEGAGILPTDFFNDLQCFW
jgi:hypothetical protein